MLHSFGNGTDGITPDASLTIDAAGNLYGTTYHGGIHGRGTVFELTPAEAAAGRRRCCTASATAQTGLNPYAGLIFDAAGNLYGTTLDGGIHDSRHGVRVVATARRRLDGDGPA